MLIRTHGVGEVANLPIPLEYAVAGAAGAIAASFAVLAFAWRTSRFRGDRSGRNLPSPIAALVDSATLRGALGLVALAITGYVAVAAFVGEDLATNPTLGVVYAWLWVGMVPLSLLFGRVWTVISPLRTLHLGLSRLAGRPPERGILAYPSRLGYWPAAFGLFSFVWLELVSPSGGMVSSVRTWCLLYAGVTLLGSMVYGTRWFERADPLDVYFSLAARLSPFGRRAHTGRLVLRNPLENLDGVRVDYGLVGVVAVLLGSTAFDSFSTTTYWLREASGTTVAGISLGRTELGTLALLALIVSVYVSFTLATMATGGLSERRRRSMPDAMAHSLVPIVVGYVFAHYLSFLLEYGQQTLINLSDPLQRGDNLLGLADDNVSYIASTHPTALAISKVGFVVLGHVLGVISAHDRSVRLLPARNALSGQLALIAVMVGYTVGGLLLLFST